ncbi:MAG: Gfo/Idh/MocA family oxidoreductase [Chlorobi bacterium]|nr:Gfo/Idh/MocA family oxidoreductase [Chlorobiota bacterium]MCI0716737.1 Gfo/Idh/MocA family oxidoreductase [Chlorobiota bacterium]
MDKTRVLISGLGGIAQIAHLPIISKMDNVEIIGVCDVDKSKAKTIAQKYNVKNYYFKFDEMIDSAEADCLMVATPTNLHKEQSIKGLEMGLNVLVEKPLARTFIEASAIIDVQKKSKKKLMVGMNNRFRPDIMMQESFISAKELGDIFYIKTGFLKKRSTVENWSVRKEESGGGVFMDLGVVMLDIALWLMKFPKVKSLTAVNYYHTFNNVEDSSFVLIRFANDSTVTIETSWSLHREDDLFYCNVYGKEGSAAINPLKIYKHMHNTLVNVTPLKMEKPANIFKRSYEYEMSHFINCVRSDLPNLCDGVEALERMKIVDAVYKSAKTGKEISFK